jgi:hypothetical protein
MVTKRARARWVVRLSVTRRGGWRAWGPVSGDFEQALAEHAGATMIGPRIDSETRRGGDYVRVTLVMTVVSADVAGAIEEAWQVFTDASSGDRRGWDLASAAAEVQPESARS